MVPCVQKEEASMRRQVLLVVSCWALFVVSFPILTYFAKSGGLSGVLLVFLLAFVAWTWGERAGLLSSFAGLVYANAVLIAENRIVQHRPLSWVWVAIALLLTMFVLCVTDLVGRLSGAVKQKSKAESAHRAAATRILAMLKALPDHVFEFDRHGRIHDFRPSQADPLRNPLGPSPVGQTVLELLPFEVSAAVMKALEEASESGQSKSQVFSVTREAKTRWYELSVAAIGELSDPDCRFIALGRDITERRTLEQQLIQSQKMEAVGRLAGGIAHDFNNILQAIIGFTELILTKDREKDDVDKHVNIIKDSAIKAASLTQHLLAFSRKQLLAPKVVDIDALVEESLQMLRRMLGENISITHESEAIANYVRVDPAQFGQVLTNLAVNARDAMLLGGRLGVKVMRVVVQAEDPSRSSEMPPGEYVLIQVSDTGSGMDEETLSHLFEPFFTTKVLGKGTGLGLSIVYGVVKQSGGYIYVQSKLGDGTTFRIYLPRVSGHEDSPRSCPDEEHRGVETILVVEDEENVSRLIFQHLSACGYKVLQASNGAEAIGVFSQSEGHIDLLLTDVVLPDTSGDRVAQRFRAQNPLGCVAFMTGYSDSTDLIETARKENAIILQKPFALAQLSRRIREVLDQPRTG
jgi:two-component system, cell cycle sensor histidine kinase and response regulator CckA